MITGFSWNCCRKVAECFDTLLFSTTPHIFFSVFSQIYFSNEKNEFMACLLIINHKKHSKIIK